MNLSFLITFVPTLIIASEMRSHEFALDCKGKTVNASPQYIIWELGPVDGVQF